MRVWLRWAFGIAIALAVGLVPLLHYRATYVHARRLRVVRDGYFYRCGQLPAAGFREAFQRYGIKTVINLQEDRSDQEDLRDPKLPETWWDSWRGRTGGQESALCAACGVKFVQLDGGVLDAPGRDPGGRPAVVDDFLAVLADPVKYPPPYLIHCHAGRDRTGLFVAVYRMEVEHRTQAEAMRELRANGFEAFKATDANEYIKRYFPADRSAAARRGGNP